MNINTTTPFYNPYKTTNIIRQTDSCITYNAFSFLNQESTVLKAFKLPESKLDQKEEIQIAIYKTLRLNHPNLIHQEKYQFDEPTKTYILIVSEQFNGKTLRNIISNQLGKLFSPTQALFYSTLILEGYKFILQRMDPYIKISLDHIIINNSSVMIDYQANKIISMISGYKSSQHNIFQELGKLLYQIIYQKDISKMTNLQELAALNYHKDYDFINDSIKHLLSIEKNAKDLQETKNCLEDILKKLKSIEVNEQDPQISNLQWCYFNCLVGNIKAMRLLFKKDPLININKKQWWDPTVIAALNGHFELLKVLIDDYQVNPNSSRKDGWSILMSATLNNHLGMVKYLIEDAKADPSQSLETGLTAFMISAQEGHLEILKYLLYEGKSDPNKKSSDGSTALLSSTRNGHLDVVKFLIEVVKVDPNQGDSQSWTAFMFAVQEGHLNILQYLIEEAKVNKNQTVSGKWNGILISAQNGHLHILKYLVEEAKVNIEQTADDGWTALMSAVANSQFEIIKYLIEEQDVDINQTDVEGWSALMFAAQRNSLEIIQYLVEKGRANINQVSNGGQNALMCTAFSGKLDISRYLIEECEGLQYFAPLNDLISMPDIARQNSQHKSIDYLESSL